MSKRHKNAHAIWFGGACNPIAVSRSLADAISEACAEGNGHDAAKDAAVQMIADHLCFLLGMPQPSLSMNTWADIEAEVVRRKEEQA
jgi:hypothetical protein